MQPGSHDWYSGRGLSPVQTTLDMDIPLSTSPPPPDPPKRRKKRAVAPPTGVASPVTAESPEVPKHTMDIAGVDAVS